MSDSSLCAVLWVLKEILGKNWISEQLSKSPVPRLAVSGSWPTFLTRCFGMPTLSTWTWSSLFSCVCSFSGWPTKPPFLSVVLPRGAEALPVCGEPPANSLLFLFLKNVCFFSMSQNKCGQIWIYTEKENVQLQPWCIHVSGLKFSPWRGHALIKELNLNVIKYGDAAYNSITLLVMCENIA